MKLYRNLPLFWKMLLPLLLVIVIAAMGAVSAVFVQWRALDEHNRLYEGGASVILRLEKLNSDLSRFYLLVLQHLTTESAQEMASKEEAVWKLSDEIVQGIKALKIEHYQHMRHRHTDIDTLLSKGESHQVVINSVIRLSADFEKESAYSMLRNTGDEYLVTMLDLSSRLLKQHIEELGQNKEIAASLLNRTITISVAILGGSGLLVLLIVLYFTRKVTGRLGNIVAWSRRIGEGDFSARVAYDANDEMGELARAMNMMARKTRKMIDVVEKNNAMVEKERVELERTVQQRTSKLNETNAQLQLELVEKEQRQQELLQAKELAEQASQAKSMFLASMSHELRTPLNAILGYAQLFDYDDNLDERQLDNVVEIKNAGSHLLELINDILDLAKIEAGRIELLIESIDPIALVKECCNLVQPTAEKNKVQITFECEAEHILVEADYVRLKQVVLNLISNAVKYNHKGGKVDVSYRLLDGKRFRINVADTGKGIPLERQSELFESFNRLGAENSNIEGTGIGLVITKQLVERMGGEIGFVSAPGQGSEFWVAFDAVKAPAGDLQQEATVREQQDLSEERCTFLYIEDNESNQKLMRQIVNTRLRNCELVVKDDAEAGLRYAREYLPDLIYMDINLPGMNGYEALRRLREMEETRTIPVIAVSANALTKDIEAFNGAGFEGYITKPIKINELLKVTSLHMAPRKSL